jgi:hypothetical protein
MSDKNFTQGLNGKYYVKDSTFFDVAKTDPMDFIEKEIGDSKTLDKFLPQQKICRWDNECNVSVRLVHNEKTPDVVVEGDDVVWKGKKVEARFYDVFNEEHPEGAGEFEITLKEKPATNVVEFTVQDKDVDYFYQPALTQEEINQGTSRPDNVVGSYAVYAKTQKTNWKGGKEYKTGKLGHIFRPRIEDSAGDWTWGELHIENGILSVTIPQEFLDKAVYPVRHAAGLTFGYETSGGTSYVIASGGFGSGRQINRRGTVGSPASSGTLDNVKFYGVSNGSNYNVDVTTFISQKDSVGANSHGLIGQHESLDVAFTSEVTLYTINFSSEAVTGAVDYILNLSGNSADLVLNIGNTVNVRADNGGVSYAEVFNGDTGYATSKEDPWTVSSEATGRTYSIYATYTASGGGSPTPTRMMMGLGQ